MTKRDELIALGGVGVKAKPLEWNEYTDERGDPDRWDAETLAGTFYGIALLVDGFSIEYDYTAVAKGLDDLEAAKAAAQADYEARIKSALVEPPSAPHQGAHQAAHAEKEKTNDTVQDGRSDHSVGMHSSGRRRFDEGESALRLHDRENHQAEQQSEIAEPRPEVVWRNGPPPKPWCDEWFIAETTYGARVILTALPDEYTYDFKTADETYIKADKIKRWMQFPDSEFTAPGATTKSDGGVEGHARDIADSGRASVRGDNGAPESPHPTVAGIKPGPSDPSSTRSEVTALVDREWQSLLDKDDRTSPEEYSDMCLITREELHGIVNTALLETHEIRRK